MQWPAPPRVPKRPKRICLLGWSNPHHSVRWDRIVPNSCRHNSSVPAASFAQSTHDVRSASYTLVVSFVAFHRRGSLNLAVNVETKLIRTSTTADCLRMGAKQNKSFIFLIQVSLLYEIKEKKWVTPLRTSLYHSKLTELTPQPWRGSKLG